MEGNVSEHSRQFAKIWFKLAKELKMVLEEELAPHLTEGQLTVLEYLFMHEPELIKPSDLVQYLSTTPAAITTLLDRMERNDLIARERDETDRRIVWLRITEKGRAEGERGIAIRDAFFASRFDRISLHNQQLLNYLMNKVFGD